MEVTQLAKAQSTASTAVASGTGVGAGSLTIELGSWGAGSFTPGAEAPVSRPNVRPLRETGWL